jgi:RNA ligase (TIGR02306 family)
MKWKYMRKLATIRKIEELNPIEGADKIELATVGGWKVVCQKGLYNVGDLAVYFEIDSWIPHAVAPFLTKPEHFPKVFDGVEGERLKTIKLRGQLSQGLLMPLAEISKFFSVTPHWSEDEDVTEILGIKKWEKAIPAQLAGVCKGNFPSLIPKTDQERVQNLKKEIQAAQGLVFEVTEKLEGSSMTCYLIDGEFGVCSRNMNLEDCSCC